MLSSILQLDGSMSSNPYAEWLARFAVGEERRKVHGDSLHRASLVQEQRDLRVLAIGELNERKN